MFVQPAALGDKRQTSLQSKGEEAKCLALKTPLSGARGKRQTGLLPLRRDLGSLVFSPGARPTTWASVMHLRPDHLPVPLLEAGQGSYFNLNPLAASFAVE